jgi:hypothetical protein
MLAHSVDGRRARVPRPHNRRDARPWPASPHHQRPCPGSRSLPMLSMEGAVAMLHYNSNEGVRSSVRPRRAACLHRASRATARTAHADLPARAPPPCARAWISPTMHAVTSTGEAMPPPDDPCPRHARRDLCRGLASCSTPLRATAMGSPICTPLRDGIREQQGHHDGIWEEASGLQSSATSSYVPLHPLRTLPTTITRPSGHAAPVTLEGGSAPPPPPHLPEHGSPRQRWPPGDIPHPYATSLFPRRDGILEQQCHHNGI